MNFTELQEAGKELEIFSQMIDDMDDLCYYDSYEEELFNNITNNLNILYKIRFNKVNKAEKELLKHLKNKDYEY